MEQNKGKNKQNQESENSDTFQSEKKIKTRVYKREEIFVLGKYRQVIIGIIKSK